ncbi:MAG: N-acetylmuramoyl-L-alanine amidase [Planctomycetes bacterium]|nr:N-acetylmuramoyl-L-alanine amidase [Planctomycetota bacterium]
MNHNTHLHAFLIALLLCAAWAVVGWDSLAEPPETTLSGFAEKYGLELVSRPGNPGVELSGKGLTVRLAPGMKAVSVNGKLHKLSQAPRMSGGVMLVPGELYSITDGLRPARGKYAAVVIDAGHGGYDTGAVANGAIEKDIVLDIGRRVRDILVRNRIKVVMTREDDTFIELTKRSEIANETPGAVFVSIHANSAGEVASCEEIDGIETFVLTDSISDLTRANKAASEYALHENTAGGSRKMKAEKAKKTIANLSREARSESRVLAEAVQKKLTSNLGESDRGVKEKNLSVLRETYFGPAILTEVGFLTNRKSARELNSAAYRQKTAQAIADGIISFLSRP